MSRIVQNVLTEMKSIESPPLFLRPLRSSPCDGASRRTWQFRQIRAVHFPRSALVLLPASFSFEASHPNVPMRRGAIFVVAPILESVQIFDRIGDRNIVQKNRDRDLACESDERAF